VKVLPAWGRFLLTGCMLVSGLLPPAARASAFSPAPQRQAVAGLRVTGQSGGLLLEWETPSLSVTMTDRGTAHLEIAGYETTEILGQPRLPYTSALLALPPGDLPTLTIMAEQTRPLGLLAPPATAPQPGGLLRGPDGGVLGGAFEPAIDSGPAEWPANPPAVTIEEIGIQRGVRLGRVVFTPVRPGGAGWQYTQRVRVLVGITTWPELQAALPAHPDPIVEQIRRQVVNPAQIPLVGGQESAPVPLTLAPALSPGPSLEAAVVVFAPGLTRITYQDLQQAGFSLNAVDPRTLQLWRGDEPVAMEWDGNGDSVFGPGEQMIFYADPRFSRYMDGDVYWLRAGTQPGTRITAREGSPGAQPAGVLWRDLLVEKNLRYTPDCSCGLIPAGRDGDRWVWDALSQPGRPLGTYPFTIDSLDTGQPAALTVWMIGSTSLPADPDHWVEIEINQVKAGYLAWDGKQAAEITLTVPGGVLKNGQNTLTLRVPARSGVAVDGMWLDAFQVRYAQGAGSVGPSTLLDGSASPSAYTLTHTAPAAVRVYDVQDPANPLRLNGVQALGGTVQFGDAGQGGARYALAAEAGLLQPAAVRARVPLRTAAVTGADYLVVTHPDFAPALAPLLNLRASQGLRTAVEDVEAIYDHYGAGRPSPEAIRAFLADAYARWSPRPLFILLVGDGTNDPRRYNASSARTFIPAMLAMVDPWMGETAADNHFVTVDGVDALPDMAIGRLPVNSLVEAQAVVAKLVGYETRPAFGPWTRTLALVADNTDASGDFARVSEDLAGLLAPPYGAARIYHQPPGTTSSEIQQSVLRQFQAGSGVMVYTGHASIHQWAAENFLHLAQVEGLNHPGRLPLLLEMSCLTASFQVAGFPTLDETLLRAPHGGVVAVWGSTGMGIATGHKILAAHVVQALYTAGQGRVGLLAVSAKTELAARQPAYLDLLDTYTLLGDPATLINVYGDENSSSYLPTILH
jgi:hypothetical protein